MSNTHPKALEAQARKEHADKLRKDLTDKHGLKFLHRAPRKELGLRGITVAYAVDRRNIVHVATTVCHPNDGFSRKTGELQAAANFDAGHGITVHVPLHIFGTVETWVKGAFQV